MAAITNYLENKLIDWLLRAQSFAPGATTYVGLYTAAPTKAGGGTEVSGGGYARVPTTSSLAAWAGTQAAGSTAVSSGTGGTTSNNAAIQFAAPSANWGSVVALGVFDAASGGNLLLFGDLAQAKTVNNGDAAPSFAAASLTFKLDA